MNPKGSRRRDGGLRGSRHHLAVDGATDFIAWLRDLSEVIGKVKDGPVTKGGCSVDTIVIRRPGDETGKTNGKTKLRLIWGRTTGRQEVVVILRPVKDRHLLDVEAAELLEKACQDHYPDFKVVNDVQPPARVELPLSLKLPEAGDPAKAVVETGLPPVLVESEVDSGSVPAAKTEAISLTPLQFNAYQRLLSLSSEEGGRLLFRGNLNRVVGGSQRKAALESLGLIVKIKRGVIGVERREVVELPPKPRPKGELIVKAPTIVLSPRRGVIIEEIFCDPDAARDKIFQYLLVGSAGIRSKGDLEQIVLVIDDVSARLRSVVENYSVAELVSQALLASAEEVKPERALPDVFGE